MHVFYHDPEGGSSFFLRSVKIKRSDLALDFTIESTFPELLVGPDRMVLYAGVGKLVHSSSKSLHRRRRTMLNKSKLTLLTRPIQ